MKKEQELTQLQKDVCLNHGTERPYTGKLLDQKDAGLYRCLICSSPLFVSDTKFDSGCGWPSFFEAVSDNSIRYLEDNSYRMQRTEIRCASCDSHLGHVFNDGPPPTGLRFCVNSVSLEFEDATTGEKTEG